MTMQHAERDDFTKHQEQHPIYLQILCPLMQGQTAWRFMPTLSWGSEQLFSLMVGRNLQPTPGSRRDLRYVADSGLDGIAAWARAWAITSAWRNSLRHVRQGDEYSGRIAD